MNNSFEIEVFNFNKEKKGHITIKSSKEDIDLNNFSRLASLAYRILKHQTHRRLSCHYRNIGSVNKSNKKIRPQKHMGRSRQGSAKEIHMRGGAKFSGFNTKENLDEHSRSRLKRNKKVNQKVKQAAYFYTLLSKASNNKLFVFDDFEFSTKTSENVNVLPNTRKLLVVHSKEDNLVGIRNIKNVNLTNFCYLNIINMIDHYNLAFSVHSLRNFIERATNLSFQFTQV